MPPKGACLSHGGPGPASRKGMIFAAKTAELLSLVVQFGSKNRAGLDFGRVFLRNKSFHLNRDRNGRIRVCAYTTEPLTEGYCLAIAGQHWGIGKSTAVTSKSQRTRSADETWRPTRGLPSAGVWARARGKTRMDSASFRSPGPRAFPRARAHTPQRVAPAPSSAARSRPRRQAFRAFEPFAFFATSRFPLLFPTLASAPPTGLAKQLPSRSFRCRADERHTAGSLAYIPGIVKPYEALGEAVPIIAFPAAVTGYTR